MPIELIDEQPLGIDHADLVGLAEATLAAESVPAEMDVTVLLVTRDAIQDMNRKARQVDAPTDVLAFAIDEPGTTPVDEPSVLGDVVLCPEYAVEQAETRGRSLQDECRLLLVHGILHLNGMDHDTVDAEREMFDRTDEILADWGAPGHLESDRRTAEDSDDNAEHRP